jgi:hypothetical protein
MNRPTTAKMRPVTARLDKVGYRQSNDDVNIDNVARFGKSGGIEG